MIDTSNKKETIIREDYLESLGYKQVYDYVYIKECENGFRQGIDLEPNVEEPIFAGIPDKPTYTSEEQIQKLLEHFKEVKNDYENCKKYVG